MAEKIHRYEGQALEVTWDQNRCIHMGECVQRLPAVFDPQKKPWIAPNEAAAEELADCGVVLAVRVVLAQEAFNRAVQTNVFCVHTKDAGEQEEQEEHSLRPVDDEQIEPFHNKGRGGCATRPYSLEGHIGNRRPVREARPEGRDRGQPVAKVGNPDRPGYRATKICSVRVAALPIWRG